MLANLADHLAVRPTADTVIPEVLALGNASLR
jgi:hypothetical protein